MQAQHQTHLETLLDSYGKVLRAQVDMDLSKTSDRDWRNLQTLLAERPDIGDRTISYLSNALQDAAEKRMSSSDLGEPWVETDLDETFPYESTEADEPVIAGIDTQAAADGCSVRIDIQIDGKTVSITGDASALKPLSDLGKRL